MGDFAAAAQHRVAVGSAAELVRGIVQQRSPTTYVVPPGVFRWPKVPSGKGDTGGTGVPIVEGSTVVIEGAGVEMPGGTVFDARRESLFFDMRGGNLLMQGVALKNKKPTAAEAAATVRAFAGGSAIPMVRPWAKETVRKSWAGKWVLSVPRKATALGLMSEREAERA